MKIWGLVLPPCGGFFRRLGCKDQRTRTLCFSTWLPCVDNLVPDAFEDAFLADHRWELFVDEVFACLFPSGRGGPSVPAAVIATVMVLQTLEGLSDRHAAVQLRTNIA